MEIIHQQSIDLERVADLCEIGIERQVPEPRSDKLWHVSSLLKASKSIIKGKVEYSDSGPASMPSIAAMGRIWETAMDCYMQRHMEERGGSFVSDVVLSEDGICGSLDGAVDDPTWPTLAVYECKLRFTLNMDIPLDHLRQIRAYCHLLDTTLVYYASGHLSSAPPMIQATLRIIRFTQQSIEENWEGIVNTKKYLESLGITPEGETTNAES